MCTHNTIHKTLVVDAVSQTELMADLVSHDCTTPHEEVFIIIFVNDAVKLRIIALEGKSAKTLSITGPSEAKVHFRTRVQVLHCNGKHCIRVARSVLRHDIQKSSVATTLVLQHAIVGVVAAVNLIQEVTGNTLVALARNFVSWSDDLHRVSAHEKGLSIELVIVDLFLGEAVVDDEKIDPIPPRRKPLDVISTTLVVFKALIGLSVPSKPVVLREYTLRLEDFFCILSHVCANTVPWKVSLGSDCSYTLSFGLHRLDTFMLKHTLFMPL